MEEAINKEEFIKTAQFFFETKEMFDLMSNDLNKIMEKVDQECSKLKMCSKEQLEKAIQCWLRMAIRTAITIIDAVCFRMKIATIEICKLRKKHLSSKEIEMLSEEKIEIRNGKIKRFPKYTESKKNLKFSFKKLAYAFDTDFKVKEDEGWNTYLHTLEIRHNITHPKKKEDLCVSAEDYNTASKAFEWFGKCFNQLLIQIKKQNYFLNSINI